MLSSSIKAQWHQQRPVETNISSFSVISQPKLLIEGKGCSCIFLIEKEHPFLKAKIILVNCLEDSQIFINIKSLKSPILILSFINNGNEEVEIVKLTKQNYFVLPDSIVKISQNRKIMITLRNVYDKQEHNNHLFQ